MGSIHFIRFPTSEMSAFISLAEAKQFSRLAKSICATGGGAYKFAKDFRKVGPPCVYYQFSYGDLL